MTKTPDGEDKGLSSVDVRFRPAGASPAGLHGTGFDTLTRPMTVVGVSERRHDGELGQGQAPWRPAAEPDPWDARRRGLHRLRLATASLGVASVVGTGVLVTALADQSAAADESDVGTTDDGSAGFPSTGTTSTDGELAAPVAPPGAAAPGPVDASSGGS